MRKEAETAFVDPLVFDASIIFNIGHRGELRQIITKLAKQYKLLVPPEVVKEIQRDHKLRQYYQDLIHEYFKQQAGKIPVRLADAIVQLSTHLGSGELDVIILALDTGGTAVIDERSARKEARGLNIPVTGTLGLLQYSVQKAWLTEQEVLAKIEILRANQFRIPPVLQGQSFTDYLKALRE